MIPFEVWARGTDGVWRWCYPIFAKNEDDARRAMSALRDSTHLPRWAYDLQLGVRQWRAPRLPWGARA